MVQAPHKVLKVKFILLKLYIEKVQVFAKDASHGLSYEKLVYNLNKRHPRVMARDSASKQSRK